MELMELGLMCWGLLGFAKDMGIEWRGGVWLRRMHILKCNFQIELCLMMKWWNNLSLEKNGFLLCLWILLGMLFWNKFNISSLFICHRNILYLDVKNWSCSLWKKNRLENMKFDESFFKKMKINFDIFMKNLLLIKLKTWMDTF